jgi:hypothetical protein
MRSRADNPAPGKGNGMKKRTQIWAYVDRRKTVEVVKAAADNGVDVMEMMKRVTADNKGREITFKVL